MWTLANGSNPLLPGTCDHGQGRACVDISGDLRLSYVHPEDRGLYTCTALNTNGNFSRSVELEVKVSFNAGSLFPANKVGEINLYRGTFSGA